MTTIYFFDLFGTLVFAISGMLAAIEEKFDFVGVLVIGFVTALGGGTLRDMLLGSTPVGWLQNIDYFLVVLLAVPLCFFARKYISKLRKSFFFFDSLGIALFTILGVQKGVAADLNPMMCVLMGVVSATFGGVTRDVLSNKVPLIFRKEIYATACFAGAVIYLALQFYLDTGMFNMIISAFVVLLIRYLSVQYNWGISFKPLN